MIASLSLLPDIKWVYDPIEALFGQDDSSGGGQGSVARAGRASRAGILRRVSLAK